MIIFTYNQLILTNTTTMRKTTLARAEAILLQTQNILSAAGMDSSKIVCYLEKETGGEYSIVGRYNSGVGTTNFKSETVTCFDLLLCYFLMRRDYMMASDTLKALSTEAGINPQLFAKWLVNKKRAEAIV